MQIEKNIAATLQCKMKAAGKTKLEFSREPGIPRSTFQGDLKGDKCLRSDSIEELAKSLNVSPSCLIAEPGEAGQRSVFSMEALRAEIQALHPQAQGLAQEAVSILETAFRLSAEWNRLDVLPKPESQEALEGAYRYISYEMQGAARMFCSYGILGQKRLAGSWMTIAIVAPFSNNRPGVVELAKLCTARQLDPVHILDVIHDFMDAELRSV